MNSYDFWSEKQFDILDVEAFGFVAMPDEFEENLELWLFYDKLVFLFLKTEGLYLLRYSYLDEVLEPLEESSLV